MMTRSSSRLGCLVVASGLLMVAACGDDDATGTPTTPPATEQAGALGTVVVDGVEHSMTEVHSCRDPSEDHETTGHGGRLIDLRALDADGNVFRATASWWDGGQTETLRWFPGENRYQERLEWPWGEAGWFAGAASPGTRLVGSGRLDGFGETEGAVDVEFELVIPDAQQDCPDDRFHYVPVEPAF